MVKLSIIILTYNSSKYIRACLESIFDFYSLNLLKGEYELVIVDNSSTDTTLAVLERYFKEQFKKDIKVMGEEKKIHINHSITIYKNKENTGFARGINFAVSKAAGEFVLFLNPDGELLDGNIPEMLDIFESNSNTGVVCGKVLNFEGKDELTAGRFYNFFSLLLFIVGLDEFAKLRFSPDKKQYIDFGSGGFMMVRRSQFEKVGGFDQNFFMYIEDMEFCYRMKKKGLLTFFYPYATIKHFGQGSSDRSYAVVQILKGMVYFFNKHRSGFYKVARSLLILKAVIGLFIGKLTNNMYLIRTYKKALAILRS